MNIESFAAFFQALWDREPFDWQERLLRRVVSSGWPATLDLPTGAGKTAALDIAVFALALDASRPLGERKQSRRIVLVVDRRVVVDQSFDRAATIARKLDGARTGILADVATALRELSGNAEGLPLLPAILRGGMPRESEWAKSPSQPVILTSTVDQVGSRLLFRGYGISERMRSVHAGLLGCDTLLLLDEVHLARPFEETLTAITRFYATPQAERLARPLQFVRMSATVAMSNDDTFSLSESDRQNRCLAARLTSRKIAALRRVNTPRDPRRAAEALAKTAVREVERLGRRQSVRAVAVIVNRVETAKNIAVLAQETIGATWTVSLLTGRMRPLDRLDKQADVLSQVAAGRKRTMDAPRLLLVSTQAIEAGADFDFDALVTECASLDALRQRFGRLDRLGELGMTDAAILAGSSSVDEKGEPDPIYGYALRETWRFLSGLASPSNEHDGPTIDFGIDAIDHALDGASLLTKEACLAPRGTAPILTSSHLDRWVQTSPAPHADPDVAPFLHGIGRGAAEVQVVWRADIEPEYLKQEELPQLQTVLDVVRPSTLEALSVPLWAAKQWLSLVCARNQKDAATTDNAVVGVADVEGTAEREVEEARISNALAWHGGKVSLIQNAEELRPGMTLIVPTSYGGIDTRFACWDLESTSSVVDRGDEALLLQRGRVVVRWAPAVIQSWGCGLSPDVRGGPKVADDDIEERGAAAERDAFHAWRALLLAESSLPTWVRAAVTHLARGSRTERVEFTSPHGKARGSWRVQTHKSVLDPVTLRSLLGIPELSFARMVNESAEAATEGDEGSFLGSPISLKNHLNGVREFARRFGEALGLPAELTKDLALSGWIHDLGKADPRFQLLLHGGDPVREAAASELLAKSAIAAVDRDARRRAQERSGYPKGMRHELLSVALVEGVPAISERAHDWDLVLHLVASHHGWCRPFAPPALDPEPHMVFIDVEGTLLTASSAHDLQRFDSAILERFWNLVRHYGYWGLAWLEAVLRLADHRESERSALKERHDG